MKRWTVILLIVLVAAGACGGDALSDEPPWVLDSIDMPDTEEEIAAVMAALPDEIDGLSRSGGGTYGVMYGEPGVFWIVQGQPSEQIEMLGMPGVKTPVDWLEYVGSGRAADRTIEAQALTGDVLWVTTNAEWETAPGQMGTAYLLDWAAAGGDWVFFIQAGSEAGRTALIDAFVTAAGGSTSWLVNVLVLAILVTIGWWVFRYARSVSGGDYRHPQDLKQTWWVAGGGTHGGGGGQVPPLLPGYDPDNEIR
jgi:hypothetical protein